MFPLFLKKMLAARRSGARRWMRWAAVLLVLTFTYPASAGLPSASLQDGWALPPSQLEPLDESYVAPPEVTFRWAPTVGVSTYRLRILREDWSGEGETYHIDGGLTSFTTDVLEPGYTYAWRVEVDIQTSGSTRFFHFTLADQPMIPTAPEQIFASDGLYDDEINMYWRASQRTAYYLLQRRVQGSGAFVDRARVSEPLEFSDDEVEVGLRYEYRVLACNSAGCSDPSPIDEAWVGECFALSAPALVSPADGAEFFFTAQDPNYSLTWEPVPEAEEYLVRVWDIHSTNTVAEETGHDWVELWGVQGDLAWHVVAIHPVQGCPLGPPSETWTYRALPSPPPAVPTNVKATDGKYTDKVVVTWKQPKSETEVENWQIYRSTEQDVSTAVEIAAPASDEPFEDMDVTPSTIYYYWVEACSHANGCSEKSKPDSGYAGEAEQGVELENPIFVPVVGR